MESLYDIVSQCHVDAHTEIEMRLGRITPQGNFVTNIEELDFEIILDSLKKYQGWAKVEESVCDIFSSGDVRLEEDHQTGERKCVIKNRMANIDIGVPGVDFDARLSLSSEVPTEYIPKSFRNQFEKKRISFTRKNVRIDMTTKRSADVDDEVGVQRQIEVELLNPPDFSKPEVVNYTFKILDLINCRSPVDVQKLYDESSIVKNAYY